MTRSLSIPWKYFSAVIMVFYFMSVGFSATEIKKDGNILQNWIRLSLIGKDQAEIELFFKDVPPEELEKVKKRLRGYVITRLRSRNIKRNIERATEIMDIQLVIKAIGEEIRYFGLEDDNLLKYTIKEEFGINPFQLFPFRAGKSNPG